MSRSQYTDDLDNWAMIKWRGMVASAIRGRRGQALLRDMLAALDALPEKRLVDEVLVGPEGEVCALGALGRARGMDMADLDPEDPERVARTFDVATCLAQEIAYENDECGPCYPRKETPEERWQRMREWVVRHLVRAEVSDGE